MSASAPRPTRPNLFIVGAPKCGTTAWVKYLRTHPAIFFPEIKEPHYFASDLPKMRWSSSRDEYERLFESAGSAEIVGEASVMYLYSTAAAQAAHDYNPDARILIFLRPQEDFLPSLHHQYLFRFTESIEDFETAWRLSGNRPPETIPAECRDPKMLNYQAIGRSAEQVERYLALFPRERIRVFRFDEWTSNPRATYLEILEFLGLEDDGRTTFPRVNEAKSFRFKWLGRLISHPPLLVQSAVRLLRRISGRNALGIGRKAADLAAAPGYRTQISDDLRQEIRRFYEEENRTLNERLARSSSAERGSSRSREPTRAG